MDKNPEGWSDADVDALAGKAGNKFALAHYLKGKGVSPKDIQSKEVEALIGAFNKEASSPSQVGQLFRKPREGEKMLRWGVKFCESAKEAAAAGNREIPVFIISEGPGNKVDRHFYTKQAIQSSYKNFDGAKCYADHPDKLEEKTRPERSIRDVVGYFHSCQAVEVGGVSKIKAILKINNGDSFTWAWDMLTEAVDYSEKFPDKDYVGLSINADGVTVEDVKDGEKWFNVNEITRVVSADIVTAPAAGGKPLAEAERELAGALRESVKAILEGGQAQGGVEKMDQKAMLAKAAEALKAVRCAVGKNPEHDKAYGGAMDEVGAQLEAIHKGFGEEAKKEGETAPPAKKVDDAPAPAQGEPDGDEKAFAAESARYASGKMTESEKNLFERWQGERMVRVIEAHKTVVGKKLAESGIPAKFHGEIAMLLEGKSEKQMDQFIASRKALLESVTNPRVEGAGAKGAQGGEKGSKLQEALSGSGLLKVKK